MRLLLLVGALLVARAAAAQEVQDDAYCDSSGSMTDDELDDFIDLLFEDDDEGGGGGSCGGGGGGSPPTKDAPEAVFGRQCGLYMAKSSIPNAGWGMYTGSSIREGDAFHPMDVSIQVADYNHHNELAAQHSTRTTAPSWLMHEYYWRSSVANAMFDAEAVDSILPGFGMLANSHTGLINAANEGPIIRKPGARNNPTAGAASHYQNLTFTALTDLPAGHEIFVEYGDEWFAGRTASFGDALPLSTHFEQTDALLQLWEHVTDGELDSDLAVGVWKLAEDILQMQDDDDGNVSWSWQVSDIRRLHTALPDNATHAATMVLSGTTSAYETVPAVIRSKEWLQENGLCLDNIQPTKTPNVNDTDWNIGTGAKATRFLVAGSVVAPAPVIHLSRQHMGILLADSDDTAVQWRGHQLLLNYAFGHPASSLLFFPYSPAVNLINHAGPGQKPNVAVRWSNRTAHGESDEPHPWLAWTVDELLQQNKKAGLLMEFYVLTDIKEGDAVLLDYGNEWQQAWDAHVAGWRPPVNADTYITAWDYDHADTIPLDSDPNYPPSWIQVRCFADKDLMEYEDDTEHEFYGWYTWSETDSDAMEDTIPCRIIAFDIDEEGDKLYRIGLEDKDDGEIRVRDVPWSGITFVDKDYTGNQFLRSSFRHEIGLPDTMIPSNWRDLDVPETCGLYMAESAIPNAGLGMYTTRPFGTGEKLFEGDVVLQVEDFEVNQKLRHWFAGEVEYKEDPEWLPANYFWNSVNTMGHFEALDIESIVPGLGMLANSHMGLVNAIMRPPEMTADLHRGRDPGAGGSTAYNGIHFVSSQEIESGAEIFVAYGDSWFRDRLDLGNIPLSDDYWKADRLLKMFLQQVQNETETELAQELWDLVKVALDGDSRTGAAFPDSLEDARRVLEIGTAVNSVPNRVRPIEWLEENGRCLDNIRPGLSTIKQAGRGAFATRKIQQGHVIAPMPLVHVRKHHMDIYDTQDLEEYDGYVWWDGKQILTNYAFGHPESSLLLFPYSPVVNYVNHNATRCNAQLRWSTLPNHNSDWLERSPDDLDSEDHAGLIMELVATRKIEPGEEVFLDYGDEWEEAWTDYVENEWEPDPKEKNYASAAELNQHLEWLENTDEFPRERDNVMTVCFAGKFRKKVGNTDNGPMYEWEHFDGMYNDADVAWPCEIIERVAEGDYYNAIDRMESIDPIRTTYTAVLDRDDDPPCVVTGIPRSAIRYFDKQYSSDLCLRTVFRHELGLPDSMVPPAWRDIEE